MNVLDILSEWGSLRNFPSRSKEPNQKLILLHFFAWDRSCWHPRKLNSPRQWTLHWEAKILALRARHLPEIVPGYVRSKIPAPMGHVSVEIPENEEGACKDFPADKNCSTGSLYLSSTSFLHMASPQMKRPSLQLVNSGSRASAHWTVISSRRILVHS